MFAVIKVITNEHFSRRRVCIVFSLHILAQDDNGSGELHLLLNTVFLIATCCERGSRTAQSLAGELFSLPELLRLVCLLEKYYASFTKCMS